MLILTRRSGEAIKIGDEISVKVLNISGNQIRLGIEAPSEVAVHREEIFDKVQSDKKVAAKSVAESK